MNKKYVIVIILLLLIGVISFLIINSDKNKEIDNNNFIKSEIENISIRIDKLSRTEIVFTIKDDNKESYTYGEWYKIEKEENGKWVELKTIIDDYGFNHIAYTKDKNNELKFDINWEWLYGKLPLGSYRLVKEVNDKFLYIEFSIAETS